MKIWVLEKKLTDGSHVYDVAIGDSTDDRIACVSQREITVADDLSIPDFLRATGPGTPCTFERRACSDHPNTRPPGYGPSCWEEMHRESDVVQANELADAVKQYEDEKRFAAFQQWCIENPELARMNRQAKRDAERRIAKLGVPPANRRRVR